MIQADLQVDGDNWAKVSFDLSQTIARVTQSVTQTLTPDAPTPTQVSILLTDNDRMKSLNFDFRGKDQPTNVLSFPADISTDQAELHGANLLGDVALGFQIIACEARDQKKTFEDHFTHLILHGLLHLLGYDHENPADAEIMEDLERQILARLNIGDPYATSALGDLG